MLANTQESSLQELAIRHASFLRAHTSITTGELMNSLLEVAEGNDQVAYHLWRLLFPIIWTSLSKSHQHSLAKPIIHLISKFSEEIAQEACQASDLRDRRFPSNRTHSYSRVCLSHMPFLTPHHSLCNFLSFRFGLLAPRELKPPLGSSLNAGCWSHGLACLNEAAQRHVVAPIT
jgi:hypothetical protein